MNHRSVNHRSAGLVSGAKSGSSKSSMETKGSTKRAFVEDFNMEHSCSNITVKLKAFSAAAEAMDSSASRNSYGSSSSLPSCVYLG
ncbi:MAG TPA: hypothetical protein VI320_18365 [Terracidiphilus sp.]|jgi:hypothetical protein